MKISLEKILVLFLVLFVLSRTGKILLFINQLKFDGILTLRPLQECPEEGRFLVTLALGALAFVTVWSLLNRRK